MPHAIVLTFKSWKMKRPYLISIFIALALLLSIARPAAAESSIALSEVLDKDGRISNLGNRSGAVDFTGFYPVIDECEGLVFLSAPPPAGWNALGSGVNDGVFAIAVSGSDVYVGGFFTDVGGNPNADYIARWDGSSWNALGDGLSSDVRAIAVSGSSIYVGGFFTNAGGNANADYVARWDGSS